MRAVSLFSGIGGMDFGLERAGVEIVYQCESVPWRREVLAARFPGVPCGEDVQRFGKHTRGDCSGDGDKGDSESWGETWAGLPTSVDLLCGGFPCQDVSVAGNRAGLAGKHTGLFWEFIRVARYVRPPFVLLENVPGLLSSNSGRDFKQILDSLVELGYGMAWRILDSRYFGVPQRRRRVFILGILACGDTRAASRRAAEVLAVGSCCERHPTKGGEAGPQPTAASLCGLGSGGPDDNDGQAGRLVSATVRTHGGKGGTGVEDQLVSYELNAKNGSRYDGESETLVAGPLGGGNDNIGRRTEDDPNLVTGATVRRLTPTECERLQGLPDGWTDLGSDSKRYAALGDAVTVNVAEWIGRRLLSAPRPLTRDPESS